MLSLEVSPKGLVKGIELHHRIDILGSASTLLYPTLLCWRKKTSGAEKWMNAGIWTGGTFSGTRAKVRTEIRKDRDRDKGHTKKQADGRKGLYVSRKG